MVLFFFHHALDNVRTSQETHCVYEPNSLMNSIGLWRRYINKSITILDTIHGPVFYLRHTKVIFVPHRKHVTSPLGA
jgi:hypothetical protein